MGTPPTTPSGSPPDPARPSSGVTEQIETQMTGARAVNFITKHVQPPAALYVTQDDSLYVLVSNVAAALSLNVTATVLLPDGRVQANSWSMTPPSSGAQTAFLFPLAESFLLNVSVMPQGSLRYGQTFVFVSVRRGGLASGINLQTLISSYLDSFGGPTWPGGSIQSSMAGRGLVVEQYFGNMAAGQGWTFTIPAYARILVHSVYANLTCSGAAANRQTYLGLWDSGAASYYRDYAEAAQTAGSSVYYSWGLKLGVSQTAAVNQNLTRSLPEIYLLPGSQIGLGAANQQSGDIFFSVSCSYEQWFSL